MDEFEYPLASSSWGAEELEAIDRVVKSGRLTMGENVKRFEREFASRFGRRYAVMVNSGSSANLIAVAALFFKKNKPLVRGDEVIVPAISWSTTYHPLQQYGLHLKFVDVDLATLNVDMNQLELAISPRTKMIVAVSILGNPAALDAMRALCDRKGIYLLEDNCESMGAEVGGKFCGAWGDLGTFSTFFSHHISTMEGGLVTTDDEELYHLCLAMRAHGWTRDLPSDTGIFAKKEDDFFEAYRFIVPGYNVRPLEISGAVGVEQLKKLDRMILARRRNAEVFVEKFQGDERFIIQRENGISSWFSFTIILNPEVRPNRSKVLKGLKESGVQFRIITGGNFLRHDAIRFFDYECAGPIIKADIAHDYGFFVGNFPFECQNQVQKLHQVLDKLAR